MKIRIKGYLLFLLTYDSKCVCLQLAFERAEERQKSFVIKKMVFKILITSNRNISSVKQQGKCHL